MRNLLRRLGQMGKAIIVSSHILPELADICNKIGIINRGEMGFNGSITELIKKVRPQTILEIQPVPGCDLVELKSYLESRPIVQSALLEKGTFEVTLRSEVVDYSILPIELAGAGHRFTRFAEKETNLESAFMALTKATGDKM
jgi:ABC-2 type transport system ATP-binding protein